MTNSDEKQENKVASVMPPSISALTDAIQPSIDQAVSILKSMQPPKDLTVLDDQSTPQQVEISAEIPELSSYMPLNIMANTMRQYMHPGCKDFDMMTMIGYLQHTLPPDGEPDSGCEILMAAQAQILNVIFNKLLQRASLEERRYYDVDLIMLAMLAQRQCRANVETLRMMRLPPIGASEVKELQNAN